jgi:hypothetical protein
MSLKDNCVCGHVYMAHMSNGKCAECACQAFKLRPKRKRKDDA